jgi:mRNA interferase MazF
MPMHNPRRGEIWRVNLDPTVGSELRKIRPCIVMSSDQVGRLPVKIVVPLTDYKPHYQAFVWLVRIDPSKSNGLTNISAADCLQIRGCSTLRFIEKIGALAGRDVARVAAATAVTLEAPMET